MSVYPTSVFPWTARANNTDVVWAADPNSLAAEIQAIETIIGINPNIETGPPTGGSATYATLNDRVTAANNNAELPYAWLVGIDFSIAAGAQNFNSYKPQNDPYSIWNGSDGTIPCDGWWIVTSEQTWGQQGDNFRGGNLQILLLDGAVIESDIWNWDDFFGVPNKGYNADALNANGQTHLVWQGRLLTGNRLQVLSLNQTFCPAVKVTDMHLKIACLRTL